MPAASAGRGSEAAPLEDYVFQVSATKSMQLKHAAGNLSVWIGLPKYLPSLDSDAAGNTTTLAPVGGYAKITPIVPDFKPIEEKAPACIRLHSTGIQVRYPLIPKARGTFKVGAAVDLFSTSDCSGAKVPKSSKLVTVQVTVAQAEDWVDALLLTEDKARDATMKAVLSALGILLAGLVLIFRKKIAAWTKRAVAKRKEQER